MKVTLTGPEFAGEYRVVEHRVDGSLVLRPDGQPELLSEVIEQTRGQAFRDEELLVHLDRIAATEDDQLGVSSALPDALARRERQLA